MTHSLHMSKDKIFAALGSTNRNRGASGVQSRVASARNAARNNTTSTYNKSQQVNFIVDPRSARVRILDLIEKINTRIEGLRANTLSDTSKAQLEVKGFLVEIFSQHLKFSEELISAVSHTALQQLTALPTEMRCFPDVTFVIMAKIVYRHLFVDSDQHYGDNPVALSTPNEKIKRNNDMQRVDAISLEHQLQQIGYEDAVKYLGTFYASNEYSMRLISEVELLSPSNICVEQSVHAAAKVVISETCFVQLLLLHMIDLYGYDLISMSLTLKGGAGGSSPFTLPHSGVLQFDLTVPPIVPNKQQVMTNAAFSFFLRSITGRPIVNRRDRLCLQSNVIPATKDGIDLSNSDSDFDKLLFVLTFTTDRVLNLTCDQAEVLLTQMFATRVLPFADLAEKLLLQIVDSSHVCAFLTRNFHLHEVRLFIMPIFSILG